jgi:hypothetical protein
MSQNHTKNENEITDSTSTIDLSEFPEELSGYALDQLEGRLLGMHSGEIITTLVSNEHIRTKYDPPRIELDTTVVKETVRQALEEKIDDIEQELAAGYRNDFTADEIQALREKVQEKFSPL